MRELIVDSFAGGGGASAGIKWATGRSPDIAINHDEDAISMHMANHPETQHFHEDIWQVDPRKATEGKPVGLMWLSPDCTHFSVALGGKPMEKNIRGLAWVELWWATTVRPRVIVLENVKEFQGWGPLLPNNRPDPAQKGRTFHSFVNALKRHGYSVEWRVLRACDYGAPTKRERFFMIARCDGRPISWPEPTHGDPKSLAVQSGRLQPWRTAAEIIDWSIECPSIFDRKKPLAANTLRRIALGIQKFVIENPNPFIAPVTPSEVQDHSDLVVSFLAKHYGGGYTGAGSSLHEPLHTITARDHHALVSCHLIQYYSSDRVRGQAMDEPIMTIPTANRYGLVYAFLVAYYGSSVGQTLDEPINTIVTKDRFALVTVHGVPYRIADIGMRMLQPHELYAGQGFEAGYIYTHGHDGRKFSKSVQVDKCGNAVPRHFARAIVQANCPELCGAGSWAV